MRVSRIGGSARIPERVPRHLFQHVAPPRFGGVECIAPQKREKRLLIRPRREHQIGAWLADDFGQYGFPMPAQRLHEHIHFSNLFQKFFFSFRFDRILQAQRHHRNLFHKQRPPLISSAHMHTLRTDSVK